MDLRNCSSNLYIELIMTTYKAIHGKTVQHLASDPDDGAYEGQIWFNTTSADYKTIVKVAGAWASGGNMNTAMDSGGSLGTQTAAMKFGGRPASASGVTIAETYDGSSWTETNDLNTGKYRNRGNGTTTAGMSVGGLLADNTSLTQVEHYDGTNWSEGTDINTTRSNQGCVGTSTAALCFAGESPPQKEKVN